MKSRFTEQETEQYYDEEDSIYRSVWDENGSVHWGFFDETTGEDFLTACANLNRIMAGKARINEDSKVLDIGCGNGNTSLWLSEDFGSQVVGVDLSGVRVENAQAALDRRGDTVRRRTSFEKASATDLPFEDGSFSHVWSQATFYHVPDKLKVLKEVRRVLAPGGTLVFDDLVKPKPDISSDAQEFVYDRLLYDTDFSFLSYQETLAATGFKVMEAHDLSDHLKLSYECLSTMASAGNSDNPERIEFLSHAYLKTAEAVDNQELGWAMYVCRA